MKGYLCASRQNLCTADTRYVFRRYPVSLRISASRHGSVLLSHRPESLPRHKLLSGPRAALSGLRCREQNVPVFASVRDCPRDRPPRSKPPRNTDQGAGSARRDGQGRGERAAGAGGTPSRLPCRRLGEPRAGKVEFIEPGDVEAALQTASAIGDDRLQRRTQGYVVPDAFTHGTSAQRTRWFMTGLKTGQVASCDTFRA